MFTHDVFVFGHPVVNWGWCVWHVFRGGESGGGLSACVRRGEWNVLVERGNSGGGGRSVHGGLHIDVVKKDERRVKYIGNKVL